MSNCKPVETYNIKTKEIIPYPHANMCAKALGISPRTLHDHLVSNNTYRGVKNNVLIRYKSNAKWDISKLNPNITFEIGSGNGFGTRGIQVRVLEEISKSKVELTFSSIASACKKLKIPYKLMYYHLRVRKHVPSSCKYQLGKIMYTFTVIEDK